MFIKKLFLISAAISAVALFVPGAAVFAAPPFSPYAPGETLTPSCAPGDPECTVSQTSTSTLAASQGGTGLSSFLTGDILYADSSSTLNVLHVGTSTNILTVSGGFPVWTSTSTLISSLGLTSSNVSEGSNLYYTDDRVESKVTSLLQSGSGINLNYDNVGHTLTISATGGGGGTDVNWTYFNGLIHPATSTNQVVIGGSSTSSAAKLEVLGGATFDSATSTNFNASNLNATNLTATAINGATVSAGSVAAGNVTASNITATGTLTFGSLSGLLFGTNGVVSAISTSSLASSFGFQQAGNYLTGLSGDITASGPGSSTATLATTGVIAKTYGSATSSGVFTVDSKGRLTFATSTLITPAWSSITGTPTSVAGYGITNGAGIDALAAISGNGVLLKTGTNSYSAVSTSSLGIFSTNITGFTYSTTTGILSLSPGYTLNTTASTTVINNFISNPSTLINAGTNLAWTGTSTLGLSGTVAVGNGGTGTSTIPALGQLLVGNAIGGYNLVSTSSLGLQASGTSLTGLAGDVVTSGTGLVNATLANTGVSAGIYGGATSTGIVTVDAKGRVVSATTTLIIPSWTSITDIPSTLSGMGIANGLNLDAVAGVSGSGLMVKTGLSTYGSMSTSSLGLLTTNIGEGSNLYYTTARAQLDARAAISVSASALNYNAASGTLSLAAGFSIPLVASTTNWNNFFNNPSSVIALGTNLGWSGNTLVNLATSSQWITNGSNISYLSGNVGIGTSSPASKFDIWGSLRVGTSSNPALFVNAATGFIGINTANPTAALTVTGKVSATLGFNGQCLNVGTFTLSLLSGCNQDVAESYPTYEPTIPGDVVVIPPANEQQIQASTTMVELGISRGEAGERVLGVVSTNPGLVFRDGSTYLAGDNETFVTPTETVVALAGRVPVKVSLENGPIAAGDTLAPSSDIQGTAVKAIGNVPTIGIALQPYSANTPSSQISIASDGSPEIYIFVQNSGSNVQADQSAVSNSSTTNTLSGHELCLDGICLTKDDLQKILSQNQQTSSTPAVATPSAPVPSSGYVPPVIPSSTDSSSTNTVAAATTTPPQSSDSGAASTSIQTQTTVPAPAPAADSDSGSSGNAVNASSPADSSGQ